MDVTGIGQGVKLVRGERPEPLLWDGSRAALVKITSGIPDLLNDCAIFI